MAASKALNSPSGTAIEIAKWKVKVGSKVDPGSILMTYRIDGQSELRKLKSVQAGTVVQICKKEGEKVPPRSVMVEFYF